MSPQALVPELVALARDPGRTRDLPGTGLLLEVMAPFLADVWNVPDTPYTLYREFQRTGERRGYQRPFAEKRAKLCAAVFQVLLGDDSYLDVVHDYVWDICEETNWVIPAHENRPVDLTAVATGCSLAEIAVGLGDKLAGEVAARVRAEIERRIFVPYLEQHETLSWWKGHNNWNGVCNGGVGCMFLLLEKDVSRLAEALALVLEGLTVFLATAFEAEGGSTEGTSYWQYGLSNVIPFGEMLRIRTRGAIDLLALERFKAIATYPVRMMLSPGHYANYSDCEEEVQFNPGLIARLAERTGVTSLLDVLAEGVPLIRVNQLGRFHNLWRAVAWWDGTRPRQVPIGDVWARDVGVARLTATTPAGAPVVLSAKAGHNGENHNQNDVGSLILHVESESLLCEPGRGLYSRDYFGPKRYENVFAGSFAHSVPRVAGQLQTAGRAFRGEIVAYDDTGRDKRVVIEMGAAYDVLGLQSLQRALTLDAESGELALEDVAVTTGDPMPLEEAFVTWHEASVSGSQARIVGERHVLELEIEEPSGATFALDVLREASKENAKPVPLKRLHFETDPAVRAVARVRARVCTR
jgi:hypothetical protein